MDYTKREWILREVKEGDREAFIGHTDEFQIRNKNGVECIATMGTGWATGKAQANARLIASAPDLHTELVEADKVICELCRRLNPQHAPREGYDGCEMCQERESRVKALAKAEGK